MPVGKPSAAAPAQARLQDFFDDRLGTKRQRTLEPFEAAMRAVILERQRIDDAAAREGQPRLAFEPGNLVGQSEPQRMRPAVQKIRIKQRVDILGLPPDP